MSSASFAGGGLACHRGGRLVFAGIDFDLGPGQALVLQGPNGSGKSSLLRLMAGLVAPAAGMIAWEGRPIRDDPEAHRARLRYVGHLEAIKPALTVAENLAFAAALHGRTAAAPALARALDAFALAALADLPGRFLSQGQRRRVALARLALTPVQLWLLDEPTLGLDRDAVGHLAALIARHRETGGRVAVATHVPIDLGDARLLTLGAAS